AFLLREPDPPAAVRSREHGEAFELERIFETEDDVGLVLDHQYRTLRVHAPPCVGRRGSVRGSGADAGDEREAVLRGHAFTEEAQDALLARLAVLHEAVLAVDDVLRRTSGLFGSRIDVAVAEERRVGACGLALVEIAAV